MNDTTDTSIKDYQRLDQLCREYNQMARDVKEMEGQLNELRAEIVRSMVKQNMKAYTNGHYKMEVTEKLSLEKALSKEDKALIKARYPDLLNEPSVNTTKVCEALANGELSIDNTAVAKTDVKLAYLKTEQQPSYIYND